MSAGPVRIGQSTRLGEGFELDFEARRLSRSGRRVKLERIPLEILILLVERRGEIVSREEIVTRIWGRATFLDTDNSIRGAIRKIRLVLKDDSERPRFVQTITGHGYRFIAPTVERDEPKTTDARETQPHPVPASQIACDQKRPRARRLSIAIATMVLATASASLLWSRLHERTEPANARFMLAVLPFENLTGDPAQDYLSDGVTEEMISQLGRLEPSRFGVIARTSVMQYRNTRQPLTQIAHELGVQYILEGSVRRSSGKVRVSAQLIQMKDQTHLWAREYDDEARDLLGIQDRIAQDVADEIQRTLFGARNKAVRERPSTTTPQSSLAYDSYLKGRYSWNKRTAPDLRKAIEYFEQAIAHDPRYARAYAGLGDSYALIGGYSFAPQSEFMPKARAAALKAIELDGNLAEAHTSRALVAQGYEWDWKTAEEEYRRAIELNPSYATAHHWYAEHLAFRTRFAEALAESEEARQLDPLSLIIKADNGVILYFSGDYDRAIQQFRTVLDAEPNFPRARMIIFALVEKGMFAEALAEIAKWPPEESSLRAMSQAYVYGRWGRHAEAQKALEELKSIHRKIPVDETALAVACVGLGKHDEALAWLNRAYSDHSNSMASLKADPIWKPLRGDPRFQDLLHRIALAE
jgi:TolB-like protein/DNA-binding winged helix-turn-helix (wHTH) protein/Tfp pilus assembly protein PilF